MKTLLTGIAVAALALTVSPVFAASNTNMNDSRYDNMRTDMKDNWDQVKNLNSKDDLKRWMDDEKHKIDQQKRDAKTDFEQRKRELKSQYTGSEYDNQVQQAEQQYKDKSQQLDQKKDRLDAKYQQKLNDLENNNNNR